MKSKTDKLIRIREYELYPNKIKPTLEYFSRIYGSDFSARIKDIVMGKRVKLLIEVTTPIKGILR